MDQIRRKPHAHEAQHSSRLIRLIRIVRCLCGCQDLMFRLTCTQRSAYQVTIFSVEWVSNDSRETNLNIQNPFDIVFRCIWHHDSSQREEKREVKSHHEFNICCVFVTLFYFPPFFPTLFEIILYGVESTGKLINATKSHMERERTFTCAYRVRSKY